MTPLTDTRVAAHVTAVYDVAVGDASQAACPESTLAFAPDLQDPRLTILAEPPFARLGAQQTSHFFVAVTADTGSNAPLQPIAFHVLDLQSLAATTGALPFELLPADDCSADPARELLIRDPSVVDDPIRTQFAPDSDDPRAGVWSFGQLMQHMAPNPDVAATFVERFLTLWLDERRINGFLAPARPALSPLLLDGWPRRADGSLDLARAPLRLLAIVNRVDLRSLLHGHAGEGRFVFGVLDRNGISTPFTLIVEYRLPAASEADILAWARAWHDLGSLAFPSEAYNAALAALSQRFTIRGSAPHEVNGSALHRIRSNEAALDLRWELREFQLSPHDGWLQQTTTTGTPDASFNNASSLLAAYINEAGDSILRGDLGVPLTFRQRPLLAASAFNDLEAWRAPNLEAPETRHLFALNTCNGCHGSPETGTAFLHVLPRNAGDRAQLSGFLRGMLVADPIDRKLRLFNDLGRRKLDLERLVCASKRDAGRTTAGNGRALPSQRAEDPSTVSEGLDRVH